MHDLCHQQKYQDFSYAVFDPSPGRIIKASILNPLLSPFSESFKVGVGTRGTLGDIDPLNKVPFKRATSEVQKGPI